MHYRLVRAALSVAATAAAGPLAAAPLACDMTGYRARPGLSAQGSPGGVALTWDAQEGEQARLSLAVENGVPVIRELAMRAGGGRWQVIAADARPEVRVVTAMRRITNQQLAPLKRLGVPITSEVIDRYKWAGSVKANAPVALAGVRGAMPRPRKPASPFRYFNSSPEVIRLVVLMYVRFPLSLRNVEDLLFERGIDICHETVRLWWNRFGPLFGGEVRRQRVSRMRGFRHWRWHLDEMYVKLNGEMVYLWRAVDHEGEVLESYVTKSRDKKAALAFMKKALKRHGSPEAITTDGLRSYGAALNVLGSREKQEVGRWANNRVENSHLPFRRRERATLRFR